MPDWIEHRWFGLPEAVGAFRDAAKADARIGTMLPYYDEPLRVLDGLSAISFLATEKITPPPGIDESKPQTITALHGVL